MYEVNSKVGRLSKNFHFKNYFEHKHQIMVLHSNLEECLDKVDNKTNDTVTKLREEKNVINTAEKLIDHCKFLMIKIEQYYSC